ncbi:MAG: hypothetical protein II977_00200, partial [Oscillospiraceae bacterium]|nr:hypothetical protein [Oscillospiraceae bacterium]
DFSATGCPEAIPCAQYLISDIQPAEGFLREAGSFPYAGCADFSATGCPEAIPYGVLYGAVNRAGSFNIFRQSMLKLYLK